MSFLKMVYFQLRLYVKNSYFVNLVITQTTIMLLYEYLANYTSQNYSGREWLIASVMGTWASCTTSAGALGYQRWQGTLPYLLNTVVSHETVLLATLAPAAIYGLISFPLAAFEAWLLQMPLKFIDLQLLAGIILLWIAATTLSYFISLFFILTRNAIEYEQLILLPILLLSGFLTVPKFIASRIQSLQMLSPLTLPIRVIYHLAFTPSWILAYVVVILLLLFLVKLMTNIVIRRAFKEGRLNIF